MPRYYLTIEYDGSRFYGWQRQNKAISVQQTIEEAYAKFRGHPIVIYGAGRTDTGVHATGQVAHLDDEVDFNPFRIQAALNFFLRDSGVIILNVKKVPNNFHARFSALSRTYIYKILNRRAPPVIDAGRVWHVINELNLEALQQGAGLLVGTHDFTSFRTIHCQAKNPVRKLDEFHIWQEGPYIYARIKAQSFLHNQVRIMMGTLCHIGKGRWQPEIISTMLEQRSRIVAGMTAPAEGLYLTHIEYPDFLIV